MSASQAPLPADPTPDPTSPRDPRRIASVVVQRVGRGPLLLGATVLLLTVWTGAFLLSEKQKRPVEPPTPPPSSEEQPAPGTRELVQRFLDEARRQAAQEAAAASDRYPDQQPGEHFSDVGTPPQLGSAPAADSISPESYEDSRERPRPSHRAEPEPRNPARDRLERALEAPPLVSLARPTAGQASVESLPSSMGELLEATERLARLAQVPPSPDVPGEAAASHAHLRPVKTSTPLHLRRGKAISSFTLAAGSLIPAVLTSGVNSDAPGSVSAVVSYDVFDSLTGHSLLIPAGSRLFGSSGTATQGQNRLEITWSRLTLPDGTAYELGAMPAADPAGATGLRDRTNRHLARTFGSALLLSAFTAAAQLSQPGSYGGGLRTATAQEVAAGAFGQQINTTASSLIDRELRVPPTLVLRPGMECNVVVTADLVFPGPFAR